MHQQISAMQLTRLKGTWFHGFPKGLYGEVLKLAGRGQRTWGGGEGKMDRWFKRKRLSSWFRQTPTRLLYWPIFSTPTILQ